MVQSQTQQPTLTDYLQGLTGGGRTLLLPALLHAQSQFGHIPADAAQQIGAALRVPLADIYGVIEFYTMLYTQPTAETIVRVCDSPTCSMAGAERTEQAICQQLGVEPGETTPDGKFMVETVPCLGMCEHAPAVLVGESPYGSVTPESTAGLFEAHTSSPQAIIHAQDPLLTARCGVVDPTSLQDYLAHGGFNALRKALQLAPHEIIAEIKASGLMGRGGAAFPTGTKMQAAAQAGGKPKYLVCNADESEPGTFKDRVLLEEDPFSVLEGMLISAYAVGATRGYMYIRGEYPRAQRIFAQVLATARHAGYLGENILDTGFSFDVELRSGAGAYICGEETALFESIEGKRGFPRIKPPFPTTHGLFNQPTVINNVETFCNLPLIINMGADHFRGIGTPKSTGPKLFCLSGDVQQPGLYELPFGVTLRQLIDDHAGGVPDGKALQAVLLGGAAGTFLAPQQLDVPLTFEDLRAQEMSLGSGAVIVFDETRDLRQALLELAHFFAHESCGKCYPCQLGAQHQFEILQRLAHDRPLSGDIDRLADVGWTMTDASLCGLGQTAATAVLSAMQHWPELFSLQPGASHGG